jgi:HipA-like protein
MNGERVGSWWLPAQGAQQFSYADSWLRSSQFRPLSLSLPAGFGVTSGNQTLTGSAVESWFDNLLLESDAICRRAQSRDLTNFFKAQVLFWMLRAIDGHAKNFSLFLNPGSRFQLTPLYDVLSAWPVIGRRIGQWPQQKLKMAMAWHGEKSKYYKPADITVSRMLITAQRLGLGDHAEAILTELITQTPGVTTTVRAQLPSGFPEGVASPVLKGLEASASQLLRQL